MQKLARATLGTVLHQRTVGGVRISATAYAPGSALPRHEHTRAYLCLVAAGAYRQTASGRDVDCARGALLVHPDGHSHANRFSPQGARCLNLHLADDDGDAALQRLFADHRLLRLVDAPRLLSRIERELAARDDAAPLALHAAVLELVAAACRLDDGDARPPWLARVLERLHDNPAARPSLHELAALAGVHPAHLARRFRRALGLSVGDYQRRLRIEATRAALAHSPQPIAAIAAAAGFADQSHYARVFQRLTGEAPRDYRRRMQSAS